MVILTDSNFQLPNPHIFNGHTSNFQLPNLHMFNGATDRFQLPTSKSTHVQWSHFQLPNLHMFNGDTLTKIPNWAV